MSRIFGLDGEMKNGNTKNVFCERRRKCVQSILFRNVRVESVKLLFSNKMLNGVCAYLVAKNALSFRIVYVFIVLIAITIECVNSFILTRLISTFAHPIQLDSMHSYALF